MSDDGLSKLLAELRKVTSKPVELGGNPLDFHSDLGEQALACRLLRMVGETPPEPTYVKCPRQGR
jgi:hypothetical protein